MITERFVNALNKEDMKKYAKQVWDMLNKAYEYCGGMAGMDSVEDLINDTSMWKMVRRGGSITCVCCYSDKRGGRKCCYLASDGTEGGVNDLKKILQEDSLLPDRKAWGEYSGKAVSTMFNQGAMPIRAEIAKEIMSDKEFDEIMPDGYYYRRRIGGELHTKMMMGNIKGKFDVPEEVRQKLKNLARKYDLEDQKLHDK